MAAKAALTSARRAQRMFLWERRNLTIAPFNETVQQARLARCAPTCFSVAAGAAA